MSLIATTTSTTDPAWIAGVGWLALRLSVAWLFLWPLPGLLKDWSTTVATTSLVFPLPTLTTFLGLLVMPLGAISIALGVYGRIGAALLAAYCIGGAFVHMALARQSQSLINELTIPQNQHATAQKVAKIGAVGNITSAWKNWTVAGSCIFMALVGTGQWSLLNLFAAHTP